jgi:hypothetical protein
MHNLMGYLFRYSSPFQIAMLLLQLYFYDVTL